MGQYKVAIIIPVFNQWALTADCLRSLREHTPDEDVQVIVVDNGSTDETAGSCGVLGQELFGERFEHLRLDENINFGPGCNLGAGRADAKFLFFLNNDTLLTSNWLPPLLASFEETPRLGAVGPLLLFPESGRVQHLGVAFRPDREAIHLYEQFPADHPLVHVKRSLQAITGAALAIPRSLFLQSGAFFEGYKNGYEDFDLCFRLRRLEYKVSCCTKSKIYHLSSKTAGRFFCESSNRNIFLNRFSNDIVHDFPHIITNDGYLVTKDILGRMFFKLKNERRDELLRMIKNNKSLSFIWGIICNEPLFIDGYDLLSRNLENYGEWSRACGVRFLRVHFSPTVSSSRRLLNAAKNSNSHDVYQSVISALNVISLKNSV
jgi:GT2 family glycosyltransferase